jgi:flagellar FliL protein
MSTAAATAEQAEVPEKKGGKKKLLLLAIPVLLAIIGAGLWFSGVLPSLLGMGKESHGQEKGGEAAGGGEGHAVEGHANEGHEGKSAPAKPAAGPVFVDLPEIIANLNTGPRRTGFLKLHAKLELARQEDQIAVTAAMPRILDLFQTYLREMRADELRGAAGTYRLREELIARANLATAPAQIVDVLFVEMLVQ